MKKAKVSRQRSAKDEMRPQYDFRGKNGVRGKYYKAYRQGHTVTIREADGTVTVQHFTLADGAVMLEPDVRAYFPNSEAVNKALRSIIALVPAKGKEHARSSR
jgi:hypothetical protein